MINGTMTPPTEPASPADNGPRRRVCKACDRCRLKKSKCDGSSPCSRCRADNIICMFGERKRSHDKVYPRGYVEMLESQQTQLVAGVQELYRRLVKNEGWTGPVLTENASGVPLIHDILERLDVLKHDDKLMIEGFDEDLQALQDKLKARTAVSFKHESSFDSTSDTTRHSSFDQFPRDKHPTFSNPFRSYSLEQQHPVQAPMDSCPSPYNSFTVPRPPFSGTKLAAPSLSIGQMPPFAVDPSDFINGVDEACQEPMIMANALTTAYAIPYQYGTMSSVTTIDPPTMNIEYSMDYVLDGSATQTYNEYTVTGY